MGKGYASVPGCEFRVYGSRATCVCICSSAEESETFGDFINCCVQTNIEFQGEGEKEFLKAGDRFHVIYQKYDIKLRIFIFIKIIKRLIYRGDQPF